MFWFTYFSLYPIWPSNEDDTEIKTIYSLCFEREIRIILLYKTRLHKTNSEPYRNLQGLAFYVVELWNIRHVSEFVRSRDVYILDPCLNCWGCRQVCLMSLYICNIYRTRKRSLPRYENAEKCEKRGRRPSFFNNFPRCFETVVKNYFEFFI